MTIKEVILPDDLSKIIDKLDMSFVTDPAIEYENIILSKNPPVMEKYNLSKAIDKNRVLSLALVPDKLIPRKDKDGNVYYLTFSKDTVEKLCYYYMMTSQKFTVQHENQLSNCYVIENWIVKDVNNDKSNFYKYPAVEGGWMMMSQINNDMIMNAFREGKLKGLSMELQMVNTMEKYGKIYNSKEISDKEIKLRDYLNKNKIKYDNDTIQKLLSLKK
jgi:hypothetical protein